MSFVQHSAQAVNIWDGGGANDNWNTAANWDTDAVPLWPQALTFNGSVRLTSNNDLSGVTVNGFTFGTTAGNFTITGNAITLGGNITFAANPGVAVSETINLDMLLSANRTVATQTNGTVVLGGVISGANTLTKTNTGTLTLANTGSSFSGGVTGTGGTLKFASIGNEGVNSSLGSGGTISSNGVSLESTSTADQSSNRTIIFQGANSQIKAAGNLTLSNVSVSATSSTSLVGDAATGTKLEISSNISGNTTSLSNYTKVGKTGQSGTLVLSGTNTFTGGLSINVGAVEFFSDANLGATPTGKFIGLVRTNAGSGYGANATVSLSFTGDGTGAAGNATSNASGTLNTATTPSAQGSGYTYAPTVVVGGIGTGGSFYAILEGQVTMAGSSSILRPMASAVVNRPIHMVLNSTFDVGYDSTFSGVITSEATGNLTKTGSAVMTLGDSNRYVGLTTINAGTISVSSLVDGGNISGIGMSSNAAANLIINSGTLRYTGAATNSDRSFTIGNSNATLDASGAGALALTSTSSPAYASANGSRTLSLTGTNTDNNSLAATLVNNGTGALSIAKSGSGSWALSAVNTYTGNTTVSAGTLLISGTGSVNATNRVSVTGGTFRYDSSVGLSRNVTVSGGRFSYNSATNYSGALTFTSGTVGGSNLAGVALTIGSGQTMAPGNSTGTLAAGATTWASGGTFVFELNNATGMAGATAQGWDLLNASSLNITAGAGLFTLQIVSLDTLQAAGLAQNFSDGTSYSWLFVDAGAAITGFSASQFVLNASAFQNTHTGNFSISQGIGVNDDKLYINYTAVPEPATWLLLAATGTFFIVMRRRRRE